MAAPRRLKRGPAARRQLKGGAKQPLVPSARFSKSAFCFFYSLPCALHFSIAAVLYAFTMRFASRHPGLNHDQRGSHI